MENSILNNVKIMLDIDDNSDDIKINYLIDSVKLKILRYCRLSELPPELENVVVQLVVNRFNDDGIELKSVGSINIEPPKRSVDELEPHKPLLNTFRRISFI